MVFTSGGKVQGLGGIRDPALQLFFLLI